MAKAKSAAERIAELEAEITALREQEISDNIKAADAAKTTLTDALTAFNAAAKLTNGRVQALRLVSDAERASSGKTGGKRLRLNEDTENSIAEKIVKAAKAHKGDGASKSDIIAYLDTSGYKLDVNYNTSHLNRIIAQAIKGENLTKQGEKSKTRYFAA